MSVLRELGLGLAGVGGGLIGSIAGLASLVTYPTLLALGLSPIAANITNTVALVWSGVGSTVGSRPELAGQSARIRRLLPFAVAGGVGGAILALVTPSGVFARIVPWLILAGSLALLRPRPGGGEDGPAASPDRPRPDGGEAGPAAGPDRPRPDDGEAGPVAGPDAPVAAPDRRSLPLTLGAIALYGGYFGAAAGVLLLAVLLIATSEPLVRANGAKNLLLGTANLAGAVVFAAFGPVHWATALPLAIGCLIGARAGPPVVRRLPARPLRLAIAVLGIGLAVTLGLQAY